MLIKNICLFAFTFLFEIQIIRSSRILGLLTSPSRSHFIIQESLLAELAARGHEVTVYSFFNQTGEQLPNYRWITMEENVEFEFIKTRLLQESEKGSKSIFASMPEFIRSIRKLSIDSLNHPKFLELKKETFDLVVFGWFVNDFQLGVAGHFRCPSVIVTSTPGIQLFKQYVGNPHIPSVESFSTLGFNGPMSFYQRFLNYLASSAELIAVKGLNYFVFEPTYNELFPADLQYPSFDEVKKNVSLVLFTDHFSQGVARANLPGFLEVAGMHIKNEANPLPEDIQKFLDSAEHGVIYFSLGSNIKSSQVPAEKRTALLKAFASVKEKVLWKFEEENLPGKSDNIRIGKWLPQADILAHPNVKVFISHCGKGSVNEAKFHGVPILGVPLFGDQPSNLENIVNEGWAVGLNYQNLTAESITAGLQEILSNPKYRQTVKTSSDLFKDRPQHPLQTAAFWVEYVLRHDGAKHMQGNGVHLNYFQYHSLDVILVLLGIAYVATKISKVIFKFIFRKIVK